MSSRIRENKISFSWWLLRTVEWQRGQIWIVVITMPPAAYMHWDQHHNILRFKGTSWKSQTSQIIKLVKDSTLFLFDFLCRKRGGLENPCFLVLSIPQRWILFISIKRIVCFYTTKELNKKKKNVISVFSNPIYISSLLIAKSWWNMLSVSGSDNRR